MKNPRTKLVERIDYYIEAGRWVFTAEYHLKRGACCQSGCRHCPYGNSPVDRVPTADDQPPQAEEDE